MANLPVEKHDLFVPSLDDIAQALKDALTGDFNDVEVGVVECPDLTQYPYRVAAKGLGGSTRLADIGGVPYLAPIPDLTRKYNLNEIASLVELPDGCLIIGPGAGPFHETGANCEYMANAFVSAAKQAENASQVAILNNDSGKCMVYKPISNDFALMGNFFICRGEAGLVIEVKARRRTGSNNFISCMREGLKRRFPGKTIALGGVFLGAQGTYNLHVMPTFSPTPLTTSEQMDNWLKFFDFPAPFVFFSEFVTDDPGWDLRLEHSHGHSPLNEKGVCIEQRGGHYHYDTTPDEVEYLGYFNVAERLYRIDRPGSSTIL